jgi:flagellar basal body-associated protein FliL
MTQQQQPQENLTESKKTSKELWLFLIFIDIIILCVLGFFIYRSFFAGLGLPALIKPAAEAAAAPDIIEEEAVIVEELPDMRPAESAPKEAAAAQPEASAPAAEKRQSVFITGAGKTRKVTFKYFGEADSAAVVAGFTMRKPVAMKRAGAEWETTLVIYPGEYRYMYIIDGKEVMDPNAQEDNGRSILIVK